MGLSKENEDSANKKISKEESLDIKTFSTSVQQPCQAEASYCEERKGGLLVFFIIIIIIIIFFLIIIIIIIIFFLITNTRTKFITFIDT